MNKFVVWMTCSCLLVSRVGDAEVGQLRSVGKDYPVVFFPILSATDHQGPPGKYNGCKDQVGSTSRS